MRLKIINQKNISNIPRNMLLHNDRVYISTKSNKVISMDTNLKDKVDIHFDKNVSHIIRRKDNLYAIAKERVVFKYNTIQNTKSIINIKIDISFICNTDDEDVYLVGTKDGKAMYVDSEYKPKRIIYGCREKIIEINNKIKDKLVVLDKKLNIIETNTTKVIYTEILFPTCVEVYNKKIICGTDNGVYLYCLDKYKIIQFIKTESAISSIRLINDVLLIGKENKEILISKIQNSKIEIICSEVLEGIPNFIVNIDNKIYIGAGMEERDGAFARNPNYKNVIYQCLFE